LRVINFGFCFYDLSLLITDFFLNMHFSLILFTFSKLSLMNWLQLLKLCLLLLGALLNFSYICFQFLQPSLFVLDNQLVSPELKNILLFGLFFNFFTKTLKFVKIVLIFF